jgi:hypothetical protein
MRLYDRIPYSKHEPDEMNTWNTLTGLDNYCQEEGG